jgi:rare lipoprotein A
MAKMHHFAPFLVFSFLIFCACDRMNEADKIKALRKAEKVTETVRRKVRATEKAEGKQDLVKDKVSLKRSARGRPFIEQTGEASSYGQEFHGKTTASGEKFDKNKLTAAHPTLPLGTTAKVTNLENGRSVEVRINDRGPHVKGRDIDVSLGAAKKLAITESGVAPVKIEATLPPS